MARASRRAAALLLAASVLAPATPARADATAAEKAAAEALFEHAKLLMKEGKYGEACPKLEESQKFDPGVGTQLYLADCYEKTGRTASAWATFIDAAAAARTAGEPDRERRANERAALLENKLNKLKITVSSEAMGLEVQRDGISVPKALWGTFVPLDPGDHTIVAAAPGKKPWEKVVHMDPADLTPAVVDVPALEDAPLPPPETVKPPPTVAPGSGPAPGPQATPPPPTPPPPEAPRTSQVFGYTLLGLGGAAAGAGGIVGLVALQRNSDTNANCRGVICNPQGVGDRNAALSLATATNVALIAGGVTFATGIIVLLATRPSGAPARKAAVSVEPLVGPRGGALSLRGAF